MNKEIKPPPPPNSHEAEFAAAKRPLGSRLRQMFIPLVAGAAIGAGTTYIVSSIGHYISTFEREQRHAETNDQLISEIQGLKAEIEDIKDLFPALPEGPGPVITTLGFDNINVASPWLDYLRYTVGFLTFKGTRSEFSGGALLLDEEGTIVSSLPLQKIVGASINFDGQADIPVYDLIENEKLGVVFGKIDKKFVGQYGLQPLLENKRYTQDPEGKYALLVGWPRDKYLLRPNDMLLHATQVSPVSSIRPAVLIQGIPYLCKTVNDGKDIIMPSSALLSPDGALIGLTLTVGPRISATPLPALLAAYKGLYPERATQMTIKSTRPPLPKECEFKREDFVPL
jgi:hypothetical protein